MTYTKSDYIAVSSILRRYYFESATPTMQLVIARMSQDFALLFKKSNKEFDVKRFFRNIGFTPFQIKTYVEVASLLDDIQKYKRPTKKKVQ